MTLDERIEALVMSVELHARDNEGMRAHMAEMRAHMAEMTAHMTETTTHIAEMTTGMVEMADGIGKLTAGIEILRATAVQDGENIRALARIAEIHERRLTDLESSG